MISLREKASVSKITEFEKEQKERKEMIRKQKAELMRDI